jgi:hypothetical protein
MKKRRLCQHALEVGDNQMRNSIFSNPKRIPVLSVTLALVILSGCSGTQKSLEAGLPPPAPVPGTIGIRNLDQLTLSMSTVTGVALADGSGNPIKATNASGGTYADAANGGAPLTFSSFNTTIMPWLSADGNAAGVTASMLLSTTGLAGIFCSTMLHNEATTPNLLKTVKWTAGSKGLTSAIQSTVIGVFATSFWRRDPSATEATILTQSISDAIAGLAGTGITDPSSQATQTVLLVPCTAALSSIAFLSI